MCVWHHLIHDSQADGHSGTSRVQCCYLSIQQTAASSSESLLTCDLTLLIRVASVLSWKIVTMEPCPSLRSISRHISGVMIRTAANVVCISCIELRSQCHTCRHMDGSACLHAHAHNGTRTSRDMQAVTHEQAHACSYTRAGTVHTCSRTRTGTCKLQHVSRNMPTQI